MPPQLVALTEGPNILLDKPILLLGRHQECDIQLGSRKVSRRHCCLAQVNDYLVVRDLGSTNGIRINGIRVIEGSLHSGDELTIGNQRYKVHWNAHANEPLVSNMAAPALRPIVQPSVLPGNDADLESCEEPVPLAEPGQQAVAVTGSGARPAVPASSVILPEELKLAPLSGERPVDPPTASK